MGDPEWMNCPGCDRSLHPSNERGMYTAGEPSRTCPECGLVSWIEVDDTEDDPRAYVQDNDEYRDPDPSTYSEAALRGLLAARFDEEPEQATSDLQAACDAGLVIRAGFQMVEREDGPGTRPMFVPTPRGHRLLAKAQAGAMGERYPLFCVDRGDHMSETRYSGPFDTIEEAGRVLGEEGGTIRRCRRVCVTELEVVPRNLSEWIVERLDECAAEGGCPSGAWANWDDELVVEQNSMEARLMALLRECLSVNAFVCEGDEEATRG